METTSDDVAVSQDKVYKRIRMFQEDIDDLGVRDIEFGVPGHPVAVFQQVANREISIGNIFLVVINRSDS